MPPAKLTISVFAKTVGNEHSIRVSGVIDCDCSKWDYGVYLFSQTGETVQFGRNYINKVHLIREFLEQKKPWRIHRVSLVRQSVNYDSWREFCRPISGKEKVSIVREVGDDLKKEVFV